MIKVGKMNQSIFFNINQILKGRLVLDKILQIKRLLSIRLEFTCKLVIYPYFDF